MSEKVMCVFECDAVPDKTFKITNVNLKQCHGKLHIRVALEMKDSKIASPDCVEDTYENDAMCEKNFNQHNFDCPALNTSVSRSSKTHWIRRIFSRLNKKMEHKTKQCREKCCVACKNPTGKTKKMEYKTNQWHEKCFCCVVCKNPIGTKTFVPRDQEIYCAGCYQDKFTTRCVKCNKIITKDGITYKNEPWHRDCFTCSHCNQSLAGQRFTSRDDKPYCAVCFGELFAKRCTACTNPITGIGVTRFISFEGRHWHNDCFICADCETSLVGRGFITNGHDINCPECAIEKLPRVKGA